MNISLSKSLFVVCNAFIHNQQNLEGTVGQQENKMWYIQTCNTIYVNKRLTMKL